MGTEEIAYSKVYLSGREELQLWGTRGKGSVAETSMKRAELGNRQNENDEKNLKRKYQKISRRVLIFLKTNFLLARRGKKKKGAVLGRRRGRID